jgi:hypothetical protein
MSKKRSGTDYPYEGADETPVVEQHEVVVPEVPEGLDEAIFRQGWQAAQADIAAAREVPTENGFTAGTHQAESWQAGYDAGAAPPV